jgi:hypothetical protein
VPKLDRQFAPDSQTQVNGFATAGWWLLIGVSLASVRFWDSLARGLAVLAIVSTWMLITRWQNRQLSKRRKRHVFPRRHTSRVITLQSLLFRTPRKFLVLATQSTISNDDTG